MTEELRVFCRAIPVPAKQVDGVRIVAGTQQSASLEGVESWAPQLQGA